MSNEEKPEKDLGDDETDSLSDETDEMTLGSKRSGRRTILQRARSDDEDESSD